MSQPSSAVAARPPRRVRAVALAAGLALSLSALTACSSGGGSSPSTSPSVTVSGAVGQKATITVPSTGPAPTTLTVRTLVEGAGQPLAANELAAVNYTVYNWSQHKSLGDSYASGTTPAQPQLVQVGSSSVLSAWNTALKGAKVGSRIEVVAPPADAFGSSGNSQAGVGPTDTLVFVLDVIASYPANADTTGTMGPQTDASLPKVSGEPGSGLPTVTIPSGVTPPTGLVANVLVQGSGEVVQKGQTLVLQYTGVDWNTGKNFDSSWSRSQPFSTVIGEGQVVAGWDQGLVGKHVGDRVLLVIPPALGYGSSGQSSAGIGGTDTLIFVVDIIDAL